MLERGGLMGLCGGGGMLRGYVRFWVGGRGVVMGGCDEKGGFNEKMGGKMIVCSIRGNGGWGG